MSHGLKHGGTVDVGLSIECPRPKEHRSERGRSCECKHFGMPERTLPHPFLLRPTAPNHPTKWVPSVFHRWIQIGDPLHWIKVHAHRGTCAGGASSTL